jgi:hypothetical protein
MRFYSSTSGEMELQADITAASTTMLVDSTTGLPGTTPFTLVIDPGTTEEIVDVTGVSSLTLTITRGVDGSSAQSHSAGAKIRHMATARDFRESQEHIAATAAHGTAGAVVGTSDTQTLTNKNLTSGTNTFPSSLATDAELSAHTALTAAHGATGAVVGTTNTQALTNKDLSSLTNTFPTSLATDAELSAHAATDTSVHGVSGQVVGTANTQALTNKNLTSGTNTFPSSLATTTALNAHTGATAAHGATGAVVGTTNAQTLTNKTISGASNSLTNIPQAAVSSLTSDLAALDSRIDALELLQTDTEDLAGDATNQRFVDVVFPTPFSTTPNVWLQELTGMTSSATTQSSWPSSITTTGFRLNCVRNNTTTVTIRWFAQS